MLSSFDFGTWCAGAVIVVGVIQWAKGLFKTITNKVWSYILPIVSIGVSLSLGFDGWIFTALGIWAISQLGYEIIVQKIAKKVFNTA